MVLEIRRVPKISRNDDYTPDFRRIVRFGEGWYEAIIKVKRDVDGETVPGKFVKNTTKYETHECVFLHAFLDSMMRILSIFSKDFNVRSSTFRLKNQVSKNLDIYKLKISFGLC